MDWYFQLSVYRWINGHRPDKVYLTDYRYYLKIKIKTFLTKGSTTSRKIKPKVSIDAIGIDTISIDPSIHHRLRTAMKIIKVKCNSDPVCKWIISILKISEMIQQTRKDLHLKLNFTMNKIFQMQIRQLSFLTIIRIYVSWENSTCNKEIVRSALTSQQKKY
jgi:hypothetical protein